MCDECVGERSEYRCGFCEKVEPARPFAGHLVMPEGWESEEYQVPPGLARVAKEIRIGAASGWGYGRAFFCGRECRGRWLIDTAALGYRHS